MTIDKTNLERMRIGRELADQLDQLNSPVAVAEYLGISTTRLRQIELTALWKISQRMQEVTGREITPGEVMWTATAHNHE